MRPSFELDDSRADRAQLAKKSTKVAVGAPECPFKVAKGAFSARGLGIFSSPPLPEREQKSNAHRKISSYDDEVVNSRELCFALGR